MKKIFCFIISVLLILTGARFIMKAYKAKFRSIPKEYQNLIHTVDNFDGNFSEIRSRDNIVESLMEINRKMHNSSEFKFVELRLTNIYTYAEKREDQLKINAAYCDNNVFDFFNLKTENNIYFNAEDYVFNENNIPVILGNNMKNKYSIGETIKFYRQGYLVNGKVIDFLCNNQNVIYFNNMVNVDDYFFIPFPLEFPNQNYDLDIKEYQFRTMLDRNNGIIVSNLRANAIQQTINSFTDLYDLPNYSLSISYSEKEMHLLIYNFIGFLIIAIGVVFFIVGVKIQKSTK